MSKPESGRWEQSLRRLAFDLHRCTEEEMYLRANERLVPLLDAASKAADDLYDAAYDDEPMHHRKANKLRKELKSWLKI